MNQALSALTASAIVVAGALGVGHPPAWSEAPTAELARDLRPAPSFGEIADERTRSIALFEEAGKVLTHPRCVNCHPASDRPTQTDSMRPHEPWVVRGAAGLGAPAMACNTCHHAANFDPAHVPGHPMWHLAPLEMAWQYKTLGQICEQIKDISRNGNKDMAALLHHMAEDSLVGWAWSPGASRTPAPGSQAQFGELIHEWAATGAHCPPS